MHNKSYHTTQFLVRYQLIHISARGCQSHGVENNKSFLSPKHVVVVVVLVVVVVVVVVIERVVTVVIVVVVVAVVVIVVKTLTVRVVFVIVPVIVVVVVIVVVTVEIYSSLFLIGLAQVITNNILSMIG